MAFMSGLVETTADRIDVSRPSAVGEWAISNAFAVALGACTLFWAAVAALFILG